MQLPLEGLTKFSIFPVCSRHRHIHTHAISDRWSPPLHLGLFHPTFFWDNHCTEASSIYHWHKVFYQYILTSNYGCIYSNIHYHFWVLFSFIYCSLWLHQVKRDFSSLIRNEPMPSEWKCRFWWEVLISCVLNLKWRFYTGVELPSGSVKNLLATQETGSIPGSEDTQEK